MYYAFHQPAATALTSASVTMLVFTGLQVSWMFFNAVVLLVCAASLARLSTSRPSRYSEVAPSDYGRDSVTTRTACPE